MNSESSQQIKSNKIYTFQCPYANFETYVCASCTNWKVQIGAQNKRSAIQKFRKEGGIVGRNGEINKCPGCIQINEKKRRIKGNEIGGNDA